MPIETLHPSDTKRDSVFLFRALIVSGILSVLLVAVVDPIWGFYESFMALMASGSINGIFIKENYHMGMSPMLKLIYFLHSCCITVPWTGILLLLGWIAIQTLGIFIIGKISNTKPGWKQITQLWFLLMFFVFLYSLIEISITGVSMLLTTFALLSIWAVHTYPTSKLIKHGITAIACILVYAGYGWRVESGLGGTLIAFVFVTLHRPVITYVFKIFWLPAIVVIIFFVRFYMVMDTHPFFRDVEPLVFYVTDSHNPPPLIADNYRDSLIQVMARNSFLLDSSTFNYPLFRKIADAKLAYEKELFTSNPVPILQRIVAEAGPTVSRYFLMVAAYLVSVIGVIMICIRLQDRSVMIRTVMFNFSIAGIIMALAYSLKMEPWHFIPIIQLGLFCNMLYGAILLVTDNTSKMQPVFIPATGIAIFLLFLTVIKENRINHKTTNRKVKTTKEVLGKFSNNLVFVDCTAREILDDYAFRFYTIRKDVYFYDMAQMPFIPDYERGLNELCQCNSHLTTEFFGFIRKRQNDIIYISTPDRVALLSAYLKTFRNINTRFTPVLEFTIPRTNGYTYQATAYKLQVD